MNRIQPSIPYLAAAAAAITPDAVTVSGDDLPDVRLPECNAVVVTGGQIPWESESAVPPVEFPGRDDSGPLAIAVNEQMEAWIAEHPESTHLEQSMERARIWEGMRFLSRGMIDLRGTPALVEHLARSHSFPAHLMPAKGRLL